MVGAPTPVIEWTLGTRLDVDFSAGLPADGMTVPPNQRSVEAVICGLGWCLGRRPFERGA